MTATDIINNITALLQYAIPVLIAAAFLFFLWGTATFILEAEDEGKRKEGKARMLWGGIVLLVIISIGGLLAVAENTFLTTPSLHTTPRGGTVNTFPSSNGDTPIELNTNSLHTVDGGFSNNQLDATNKIQNTGFFRNIWKSLNFGQ